MLENAEIVMEGTWLYDGTVTCYLRIVKWNVAYGSADYEDPPEICNDKEIECYYVLHESMIEKGRFHVRTGPYMTIEEAMDSEEKACSEDIKWNI